MIRRLLSFLLGVALMGLVWLSHVPLGEGSSSQQASVGLGVFIGLTLVAAVGLILAPDDVWNSPKDDS